MYACVFQRLTNFTSSSPEAGVGGAHFAVTRASAVMGLDVSLQSGSVAGGCCSIDPLGELSTCGSKCALGMNSSLPAGGGAVALQGGSMMWCSACLLSSNVNGGGNGGAFSLNGSSFLALFNSTLDKNAAKGNGSDIYAAYGSFVTVEATSFTSTLWRESEGIFFLADSSTQLLSSSFEVSLPGKQTDHKSSEIFLTGNSSATIEGTQATTPQGGSPALFVVVEGPWPQVFMSGNSGIAYSGPHPPLSCPPFTCQLEANYPSLCPSLSLREQELLLLIDGSMEVLPDDQLQYCHPYDGLAGTQATPQRSPAGASGQCLGAATNTPTCLAGSLMEVTTCESPCGDVTPPNGKDWMPWVIATSCAAGLLLVTGTVLVGVKRSRRCCKSRTQSLQAIDLCKTGTSLTQAQDMEAYTPKLSNMTSICGPHNSPDSDEYITFTSPSNKSQGGEISFMILDSRPSSSEASKRLSDPGCHAAIIRSPSTQSEIDLDVDFEKEIFPNLKKENLIGAGGFGEVYKMDWRGHKVAVKVFPSSFCGPSEQQYESYLHELKLMAKFQDIPQIVRLWGACLQRPHMALVYELVEGGSLAHRIHSGPPMTFTEIMQAGYDIAVGLSYLHPTVVHRDLKPGNVLVGSDGTCKLIDFGLSRGKDPFVSYLSTEAGGTPNYMAPEVFSGSRFDEKVDIWSVGMILYECLTCSMPFNDCTNLAQIVFQLAIQRDRPVLPEATPWPLVRLVKKCWADEPFKRPSAHEIARLLQIMLQDGVGEGGDSSLVPSDIVSSDNSEASSDVISRQARTRVILAAAAAAGPEAEQALRNELREAGMDNFVLTPFGSGPSSAEDLLTGSSSGQPAQHLLA